MEVRAITKFARISPLKARDVAREIQGMPVSQALDVLTFTPRKAAHLVGKTLKSAIANAENNHELSADGLVIKEAIVNEGPGLRRYKPRARGSAGPIRKRMSHIYITLSDEIELPEARKKSSITRKKKLDKLRAFAKSMGSGAKAAPKKTKEEAPAEEEAPAAEAEEVVEAEAPAAEAAPAASEEPAEEKKD